ncbi:MAG: hypothetical protein KDK70_37785 [Myxococcales bacterium]|nr:hypothetical protein [Myxococcales bacterium]
MTSPEGVDDTAGITECPQTTAEALRGIPGQHRIRNRLYRSALFLGAHNISGMDIEAEFEVHANTLGEARSIELPLPPHKRRYTVAAGQGKKVEVDLQLGYEFNVLREGEPAEIHLWGRVLSPFQTPMAEIYSVVVSARLDPDGWIYYFDHPKP